MLGDLFPSVCFDWFAYHHGHTVLAGHLIYDLLVTRVHAGGSHEVLEEAMKIQVLSFLLSGIIRLVVSESEVMGQIGSQLYFIWFIFFLCSVGFSFLFKVFFLPQALRCPLPAVQLTSLKLLIQIIPLAERRLSSALIPLESPQSGRDRGYCLLPEGFLSLNFQCFSWMLTCVLRNGLELPPHQVPKQVSWGQGPLCMCERRHGSPALLFGSHCAPCWTWVNFHPSHMNLVCEISLTISTSDGWGRLYKWLS